MSRFWKVPRYHPDSIICCIGGGPSLAGFDLEPIRQAGPGVATIAINNSAVTIAPWAEFVFFGDGRWWRWNGAKIAEDYAGRIVTASAAVIRDGRVLRINKEYNGPVSADPTSVCGIDSGAMSTNLAYHLGARRIVLLGYDMKFAEDGRSHHHDPHEFPSIEQNYVEKFAPQFPAMVEFYRKQGIEVVTCTPTTLDCVPLVSLEEALR